MDSISSWYLRTAGSGLRIASYNSLRSWSTPRCGPWPTVYGSCGTSQGVSTAMKYKGAVFFRSTTFDFVSATVPTGIVVSRTKLPGAYTPGVMSSSPDDALRAPFAPSFSTAGHPRCTVKDFATQWTVPFAIESSSIYPAPTVSKLMWAAPKVTTWLVLSSFPEVTYATASTSQATMYTGGRGPIGSPRAWAPNGRLSVYPFAAVLPHSIHYELEFSDPGPFIAKQHPALVGGFSTVALPTPSTFSWRAATPSSIYTGRAALMLGEG